MLPLSQVPVETNFPEESTWKYINKNKKECMLYLSILMRFICVICRVLHHMCRWGVGDLGEVWGGRRVEQGLGPLGGVM